MFLYLILTAAQPKNKKQGCIGDYISLLPVLILAPRIFCADRLIETEGRKLSLYVEFHAGELHRLK